MSTFGEWWDELVDWVKSLFWSQNMELALLGLQNSGKSTLLATIANEKQTHDPIPTVGFNSKKVTKGNTTIKLWDVGGQSRFRSNWPFYARGCDVIVYVVDSADPEKFEESKEELFNLMEKTELANIPVLFVGNKNDLDDALSVEELIET
eukprot:TRINITY_DN6925_c0_g1_i2.p1 TRINITY_DN6925_c0_g1~~TRINITY_DN6925_c0_g1_i2.p1  ORF type:complete len:165 (+),score=54.42 TRINITY_DN6925_c0_g1_i2:47-496(+)